MKPPITAAQAMSHPAVFETVNSFGKMADELRAEVDALTKERDIAVRKLSALSSAHALENLYQAGLDQEREITRLKKERDALNHLMGARERQHHERDRMFEKIHPVYHIMSQGELVGHMSVEQIKAYGQACREAALEDAARLCNGEQWMMSGKKSIDYINAFNEGCTDCEAVIRRLT